MLYKYLIPSRRDSSLKTLGWLIRKSAELLVNRLKVVRIDNSFANETETIEKILSKLTIECNFLVDIGAADGVRQSSTVSFFNRLDWNGALFEYDSESFAKLAFLYNDRSDIKLCKSKVTPANIVGLLESMGVPKNFGFLNIDIDSYDLSVIREILNSGFTPFVISMEINESFPPEIMFEVLYEENHAWESNHFFGCSLSSANATLESLSYVLVKVEYNNAIFVKESDALKFSLPISLEQAYYEGYLNREDRTQLFPWNTIMEFLHSSISTQEKIKMVDELFSQYRQRYVITETP